MENDTITSDMHPVLYKLTLVLKPTVYAIAFLGNAVTLVAILRSPHLRTFTNALIISLAVADMLVGMNGLIGFMLTEVIFLHKYNKSESIVFEFIVPATTDLPMMASILHLVALSVERSIAIFMPLRHRTIVGEKFMKIAIIIVWSFGFCLSLVLIPMRLMINTEGSTYTYALYATVSSNIIYLIIMLSLLVMGFKTIIVVREKTRTVPGQNRPGGTITGNIKATKRISLLLLAYIINFGPHSLTMFVYMYPSKYKYFISNVMPFLIILVLFNSCLNVVIYSTSSTKYKKAYKSLFNHLSELVNCCPNKI